MVEQEVWAAAAAKLKRVSWGVVAGKGSVVAGDISGEDDFGEGKGPDDTISGEAGDGDAAGDVVGVGDAAGDALGDGDATGEAAEAGVGDVAGDAAGETVGLITGEDVSPPAAA